MSTRLVNNVEVHSVDDDEDSRSSDTVAYDPPSPIKPASPLESPESALLTALEQDLNRLIAVAPLPSAFETPKRAPNTALTHAAVVQRNGLKRRRVNL